MDSLLLEELISILEKEAFLYREFLYLLKEERDTIASFSLDRIAEITRKKVDLIDTLREAEGTRAAIVGSFGDSFKVEHIEFTISYLIGIVAEPYASRLKDCANNLSLVVREVSEFNKDNGILIERSLKYINDSIHILSGLVEERHTYTPHSHNHSQVRMGRVFSKEA